MFGSLSRGEFVKLAYKLGRGAATGVLEIVEGPRARHQLQLRRGYLTGAAVEGHWAPLGEILRDAGAIDEAQLRQSLERVAAGGLQGRALRESGAASAQAVEAALRRQAELRLERLAAITRATYRLDPPGNAPAGRAAGGVPVALAAWARRHVEARLDAMRARTLATELAGARLAARKHLLPDLSECDETDRRIIAAMASPRRLDELESLTRAPRFRLLALLHFLREVDALELAGVVKPVTPSAEHDPIVRARRLLGVAADANADAVRRAYLRLARELHPDAHPYADESRRRELALRFANLGDAYRSILAASGPAATLG